MSWPWELVESEGRWRAQARGILRDGQAWTVDIEAVMPARSYLPRLVSRLVLAAAALASIATSAPLNEWLLDQRAPLEPMALADPEPTSSFAIQAVLRSAQPLTGLNGDVSVHLELRARDVTGVRAAEVLVTLESPTRPPETRVVSIPPGGSTIADIFEEAFEG